MIHTDVYTVLLVARCMKRKQNHLLIDVKLIQTIKYLFMTTNNADKNSIKGQHYSGLRHAVAVLKHLIETKKEDGSLDTLTAEEALKLAKFELHKVMQEMRKL